MTFPLSIIYDDIKAGKDPSKEKFDRIMGYFGNKGAEKVVLGCTELSLLRKSGLKSDLTVDAMEILAKASITACGYEVRGEYL